MRNGRVKSVISLVLCSVIMAIFTIAANVFAHQNQGVAYAAEAVTYTSTDGVYTVTDTGVLTSYSGSETVVAIPSVVGVDTGDDGVADRDITITTIGAGAFSGNDVVLMVTLPETITAIQSATTSAEGAFSDCDALQAVFTTNNQLTYVGDYAFYGCDEFNSISTGDFVMNMSNITHVGISAFEGCAMGQDVVLSSIQSIGHRAFVDCGRIQLCIPSTLNNIKYYSSTYSTPVNIETVSGDDEIITNNRVYTNNEKFLTYLDNIGYTNVISAKVTIGGSDIAKINEGLTLNFSYNSTFSSKKLYRDGTPLTDTLGDSYTDNVGVAGKYVYTVKVVDVLGETFEYTYEVTIVETDLFKDFTVKDGVLIKYNGTDTIVNVPEYVDETYEYGHITAIGKGAFAGNTTITSVVLADSIDTIEGADFADEGAFANCTALTKLQANAITNIGDNAFMGATTLTTIGSVDNECNLQSLEKIGKNVFVGTNIQGKIKLNAIESIGENAFMANGIEYIYIPANRDIIFVSEIYPAGIAIENATEGMFANDGMVYTTNAKVIAFLNVMGYSYITTSVSFECEDDIVVTGGVVTIKNIVTTGDVVEYNWYVNGSKVAIVDNKITLTTLGNNVITLKVVDAFGNEVEALNSHTVKVFANDNFRYFTVVDGVLTAYTGTDTDVVVPNYLDENLSYGRITTIGYTAFTGKNVVRVTLSNGITVIQDGVNTNGAFSKCYSLVEVVSLGNVLTTIGDYAFMDCYDLTTVKANAVSSVGKYSFSGCSKLVTFGDTANELSFDSMVKIGAGAFMNNRFERVILKNIENIGEYSFLTDSDLMQYLAIGNKQNIVVENQYTTKKAIEQATEIIMPSSAKIYSVNEKVMSYATRNGIAYETLTATIEADKVELVKGQKSNFTAIVTGLDVVYQWVNSGVDIALATQATYEDTSAIATTREIALKVVDILGNEKTSNVVRVRYYSDNTYTLFEINGDGVLIKYHGTATNVIVPEYIDKDISSGRITSIGNGAFRENATLVTITLPQSVTSIASASDASEGAFYGCVDLRNVIVTNALTFVGDYAFSGCLSLVTFGYDGTNNNLTKLTYVGISAFNGTGLNNLILKDVVTIGENAFRDINATYLGIASNSDAIKVKTISSEMAIAEASALITNVQIYTNNADVVTYATNNNLHYLVTSVKVTGATKAVIGENVTLTADAQGYGIEYTWMNNGAVVQPDTYEYVIKVTSATAVTKNYVLVIIDALGDTHTVEHGVRFYPDNLYYIFETENGVLVKYNGDDTDVVVPEYVYAGDESTHIIKIGASAFSGNDRVVSVTLPASVIAIESGVSGHGAFSNCANLEYVVYTANLVDIGDYAFSGCVKLAELRVAGVHTMAHLTTIGKEAFYNTTLVSAYLTNVQVIGNRAFVQVTTLSEVVVGNYENIKLKQNSGVLVDIESATERITSVAIYTNNAKVITYASNSSTECIVPQVVIGKWQAVEDGDGNVIPESDRVVDTKGVVAILGDTVTVVAKVVALSPTYKWSVNGVEQASLLTKDITFMANSAGNKLYVLTVTDVIGNVIASNTYEIMCYASNEEYEFVVENGVLVEYNGTDTIVNVPSVVGGKEIHTIGKGAFNGKSNITQIILANSVHAIETATNFVDGAFYGCSALTDVISKDNALNTIGAYAFYGCGALTNISATVIALVGDYAFYNASNLKQIGNREGEFNLTQALILGTYAIYGNNSVSKLYLDKINTMGEYAIRGNAKLDTIYIGSQLVHVIYENLQGTKVTENIATSRKTIIETVASANAQIYVYNNNNVTSYFDAMYIDYVTTAISTVEYTERVLVNNDYTVTAYATGLDITYAWYKDDAQTAIATTNIITINETVSGTHTYRLVVTDRVGNSVERTITIVAVEYENELYFIVEDGVLVEYLGVGTEIVVPTYKNGVDGEIWITELGEAFKNNTTITKVVLGLGVTTIKDNAFSGATKLTTVMVTNALVEVGNNVFNGLTKFALFTIDGVNNDLTNLVSIGDNAFRDTKIDKVQLTNIESIGVNSFTNVSANLIMIGNKDGIVVTEDSKADEAIETTNRVFTDKNIYSANEDVIAYIALNNIEGFTTLSATIVADNELVAKGNYVTFTATVVGQGVTYTWFANSAEIAGETDSTLVTTHNATGEIVYTLKVTDAMGGTITSNPVTIKYLINENYVNFVVEDGVLVSYIGSATEVVVPDYLDVTNFDTVIHTISVTAFRGNNNITSIKFGSEVTLIEGITINESGDNVNTAAFYGCNKLETVVFDNDGEVTIGACAFYNCRALTTVTFSAETIILGEYAFYSNTNLREVVGVNNITISAYTFYDCGSLVQVGASNNVVKVKNTTLPEYAFFRCGSVASFDLTEVTAIETCALNSCGGVTDLVLTQVTSIASSAIYTNTSNNVNIVINKDITSEGLKANSIGGTRVTLYSTMDSYVKTFAEANRINFVGVNMTGYASSYVYPINSNHTLSVVGTGYGNLTYAWSKDGSLVQTSASNELVISSTTTGTSTYRVMLTDSVGYSYTTEIEVTFVADYYEVSTSIGTDGENEVGGSVNTSTASVAYLDSYTITIIIDSEYRLYLVTINGETVDINLFNKNGNIYTYQVENVDKAQDIVVTTKILAYEVVVSADSNVALITSENMLVDSGNGAVISFTLNDHYVVDEILVDGVSVDLSTLSYEPAAEIYTYNLTNVTKDALVVITTKYASYTVSVNLSEGGSLANDVTGSYVYGTSITITPIAEDHYKLKEVKINGTLVTVNGSYTFTLEANTVVDVVFALEEMTLMVTVSGGTVAQNRINVPYGNNGAIVVTSSASNVYSVEIDGSKVQNPNEIVSKDNGTYTITVASVTKNMSVTVVMGMYINITGGEYVNTTPANDNGKILVPYNANQSVIMDAIEDYILISVKINDVEMLTSSVNRYIASFDGVVEEQNVVIVTRRLYDVTSSITNGRLVSNTTFQVENGSDAEVVFSVNDNYTLTEILVNGETFDLESDNLVYNEALQQYTLTIDNVTEDMTVAISATINKVQVIITVDSHGSVKVGNNTYSNETVTIEMDYGSSLVMVIKPYSEYVVDSVVFNGDSQDTTITTIANITNATNTLNVTFKLVQYAVQVSAGDNNVTIVTPNTQNVDSGSSVTIQFRVAEHYHYDNIKVNGVTFAGQVTKVDNIYSFTITDITKAHTVQVYSAIDIFTVNIQNLANATVTPATSVSVPYGNGQSFAFTLDSGYELLAENVVITNVDLDQPITAGWTLSNNVLEIGMVRSNINISVNVTRKTVYYNISFASNALVNPINPVSQTSVEENTDYTFEFTVQANYEIVSVVINTTEFTGTVTKGDNGVYTFNYVVTNDIVVTVNVAIVKHSITVVVGQNGTVSPNANVIVNHGASQTFVITPNSNYDIDEVLLDGQRQTVTGNTLVIDSVESDMVLNVTFKEKLATYDINITVYGGVLANSTQNKTTVTRGNDATLYFSANAHYHLDSVVVDSENVDIATDANLTKNGDTYAYSFTNVTANHTVTVRFVVDTYDIAVNVTGDGTVAPKITGSKYTVNYGATQSFVFTALAGYKLESVLVDGVSQAVTSDTTYTVVLESIAAAHVIDVTFVALPNVYVVTVAKSNVGGVITSGEGRNAVTSGGTLDIYVKADIANEYVLDMVNVNGVSLDLTDTNNITDNGNGEYVIHIVDVQENTSVMVVFSLKKYAVNVSYNSNGSVYYNDAVIASGSSVQVSYTNNITFEVMATEGYELLQTGITTSVPYNTGSGMYYTYSGNLIVIYNVTGAATFALNFTEKPVYYDITVSTDANITVDSNVPATLLKDSELEVEFTVSENYEIASLTINNEVVDIDTYITSGADNTYTLRVVITKNVNIVISTELVKYDITITNDGNGTVYVGSEDFVDDGVTQVTHGSTVVISVMPNTGYEIATITLDGESVEVTNPQNQSISISSCSAAHAIEVTFTRVIIYYTVNVSGGLGGTVTNSGTNKVQENSAFSVVITPNASYELETLTVDGESVDLTSSQVTVDDGVYTYSIAAVTKNTVIVATFARVKYNVTLTTIENGSVSVSGVTYTSAHNGTNINVTHGSSLEFSFIPNEGYRLASFKVDGVDTYITGDTYTLSNIEKAHTIAIVYEKMEYTITITHNDNGSVSESSITVLYGDSASFNITPNTGYTVGGVYVDGVKDTVNLTNNTTYYTFTLNSVVANHSVEVTFVIKTVEINVTIEGNGSVDISTVIVNYGSTKTMHIYPDTNNHLLDVLDNGVSKKTYLEQNNSGAYVYTLSNIVETHNITVKFEIDKVVVTSELAGNMDSVTIDKLGESSIDYGSDYEVEIIVNAGYILQNVFVNGVKDESLFDKTSGTYTLAVENVTKNTLITVVTIKDTYTVTIGSGIEFASGDENVAYKGYKTIYIPVTHLIDLVAISIDGVRVDANEIAYNSTDSRYEYTITNVTKDITVSAITRTLHNLYTIVVGEEGGITVAPLNGRNTVATGANKIYKLTLAQDYYIYSIKVSDGENVQDISLNTLVATEDGYLLELEEVTQNLDIVVTIATGSYKITIESGANGKTLPEEEVGVSYPGESKIIVFYPDKYYTIDYVEIDGDEDKRLGVEDLMVDGYGNYCYEFESIFADHTLKVVFKLIEYTVTVNVRGSGFGGEMTAAKATITYGETVDYSLNVYTDYVLVKMLQNGVEVDGYSNLVAGNYTYTLSNVTADTVFDLYFADSAYDITVNVNDSAMGSVNTGSVQTVAYNSNFTFEFTANDGYVLEDVLLDGESVLDAVVANTYTLENVDAEYVLTVIYNIKRTITITLNDENAGYINVGTGEYAVVDGSTQNIAVFVNYGYLVESITVNGEAVTDIDSLLNAADGGYYYVINAIGEDYTIEYVLVRANYNVYISKTSGGNVTPYSINAIVVAYKGSIALQMTPYTNNVLKSIVVNGEDVTDLCLNDNGVYTYTIVDIRQDYNIEVGFASSVNNIVITINGEGTVNPAPNGNIVEIPFNGSQAFTFAAKADYVIASLVVDGNKVVAATGKTEYHYAFNRVQVGHEVVVTYVPAEYSVEVAVTANGTTDKTGNNTVAYLADFSVNITPNAGYTVKAITINSEDYDLDSLAYNNGVYTLTLEDVQSNYDIVVTFDLEYVVTINANIANVVLVEGDTTLVVGSSVQYVIRLSAGYMVTAWSIDGTNVDLADIFDAQNNCYIVNFTNITENHTIDITLVQTGYGITIVSNNGGYTSEIGTIVVDYASDKDIVITPDQHYHVASIKLDGVEILGDLTIDNGSYVVTVENVVSDRLLEVVFELDSVFVELVINNTTGGYVVPSHSVTLLYGQTQSYEINVYADYVLAEVKINDVDIVDLDSIKVNLRKYVYTFNAVTEDQKIEITFAREKYTIQNTASQGGSISANTLVNYNEEYKCYITPEANYEIASVSVNGVDIDLNTLGYDEGGYYVAFSSVKQNYIIRATFKLQTFTITVNIENEAYGNVSYAKNVVEYGKSVTFNITPNAGYIVASVKVDGVTQANVNTYVFSNVVSDHTIDIKFAKATYRVETFVTSGEATGYVVAPSSVNYGADLVVQLYPSAHYVIGALTINGKDITDISDITDSIVIEDVDDDYILEITFVFTYYDITIEENVGGIILGDTEANPGDAKVYEIVPNDGYTFSKLYVNGVEVVVTNDNGRYFYEITNINGDYVIRAEYVKNAFTITFMMNNTGWGSIIPAVANNVASVEYGSNYVTVIRPRNGYIVASVLVDGVLYETTNDTIVFTNVTENHVVNITFVINKKYTISTYQYTNHGTISVNSEALVGQKVTFIVTPVEGYKIKSLHVYDGNGQDVAYDSNYTFTMPNSAVNIRVEYEKIVVDEPATPDDPIVPGPGDEPTDPDVPTPPTQPEEEGVDTVMIVVIIIVAVLAVGATVTIVVIVVIKKKNQPYFHSR